MEYLFLGLIILGLGLLIIRMANITQHTPSIPINEIDARIGELAKEIARLVVAHLQSSIVQTKLINTSPDNTPIEIDDSIIPMKIDTDIPATNLDGFAKEETKVDISVSEAKAKLAKLIKDRENK